MTAYYIAHYDIADPEAYRLYVPGSLDIIGKTLQRHGGRLLASDLETTVLAGTTHHKTVLIEFPSLEAARSWFNDPDYAAAKALRLAATTRVSEGVVSAFEPLAG
jgi:uncharacterized protein (DUF1330 family)